MKSACFSFTVCPTEKPERIIFCEVQNSTNPYHWRKETYTFCAWLLKNNRDRDYFSSFTGFYLLFDYQADAFGEPEIIPAFVFRKSVLLMPKMTCNKGKQPACKKNTLKQEAYEQLYSIKSYNIHYEEPEVIMYCQCLQWDIGTRYIRGASDGPEHKEMTAYNPSRDHGMYLPITET